MLLIRQMRKIEIDNASDWPSGGRRRSRSSPQSKESSDIPNNHKYLILSKLSTSRPNSRLIQLWYNIISLPAKSHASASRSQQSPNDHEFLSDVGLPVPQRPIWLPFRFAEQRELFTCIELLAFLTPTVKTELKLWFLAIFHMNNDRSKIRMYLEQS